jgi:hypothetical protein
MIGRTIVVAPIAKYAVADAANAYGASRPGYQTLFLSKFTEVVGRIAEYPESCPVIEPGVRRALFPRPFPFCVLYLIDDARVIVADVLPTAANPERWATAVR